MNMFKHFFLIATNPFGFDHGDYLGLFRTSEVVHNSSIIYHMRELSNNLHTSERTGSIADILQQMEIIIHDSFLSRIAKFLNGPRRTFHLCSFFFCLLSVRCPVKHFDRDRKSSRTRGTHSDLSERYQRPVCGRATKLKTVVIQSCRL